MANSQFDLEWLLVCTFALDHKPSPYKTCRLTLYFMKSDKVLTLKK